MSTETERPFVWRDKPLETIGDLMQVMYDINREPPETREATAAEFMSAYRATTVHADANIGYLTGYADPNTARKMQALFKVRHPITSSIITVAAQLPDKIRNGEYVDAAEDARWIAQRLEDAAAQS